MNIYVERDKNRTVEDSWKLDVQRWIGEYECSMEIRDDNGEVVGWVIKPLYE